MFGLLAMKHLVLLKIFFKMSMTERQNVHLFSLSANIMMQYVTHMILKIIIRINYHNGLFDLSYCLTFK